MMGTFCSLRHGVILWHSQFNRFLKRYTSIKHQTALMLSVTLVFFCLVLVRTPWLESIVEPLILEATGYLAAFSQKLSDRINVAVRAYSRTSQFEKIKHLEKENALLRSQFIQMGTLQEEKKILEKIVQMVSSHYREKFCTAPVLTSPLRGWNRMFLVGAGRAHGVKRGQPVICADGIVGRIDSVSEHFSRVMPITHQDFRIPVTGLKTRVQAILAGNDSENPFLIYLQDDHPVSHKEIFVSSAQGGAFPSGYLVGQLIYTPDNRPLFQTLIPWSKLEFVQIFLDFPFLDEKELKETALVSPPSKAAP